ncbi:N1221-domain-containing protein [Coniophora puteana RWD-64-598 SS2]|uniref:N1221-domain-containing protein n=1 Tax=Coniophora puteana (strain RWD-64-598) TaxID=741705 RepID=A0A5M3MAR0_CONPW|nr:N1221-domain-containing protein [Coniophora puteana RWD-64-598 SS2]EIW76163.1 N1221-domain-containing protein [Coniophora puteana RWD-64-598 SS2]
MSFSQPPSYGASDSQDNASMQQQQQQQQQQQHGLDSITLGQLRAMVSSAPKPKQSYYDFRYDDEDTVMNEIDEFYSYVEMPQVAENLKAWQHGSFPGDWTSPNTTDAQRKVHIEVLLESLEHRDAEVRFTNARRLLYILQGTFAETTSPEHQLHWVYQNCKMVRAANGLSTIVESMKIASQKHDLLSSLSDADAARFHISPEEKADFLEEVITEISVLLGMLYHLIEIFKERDDFADELMSMDPPLPVYFFKLVSILRDRGAKGYPIKKLLLVLWKSLLACCGGIRELSRVKLLARELADLPNLEDEALSIKCSPFDMEAFQQETSVKYPTFTAPAPPTSLPNIPAPIAKTKESLPTSKLAQAYSPIPVRHHYHHDDHDTQTGIPGSQFHQQGQNSGYRPNPQPATPAPSPPPSPKPKKQQYQTDQNRPFLFPFSKKSQIRGGNRLIPFAIDEADKLYNKHMYVSLALWQMWRTREECMIAESGLDYKPDPEQAFEESENAQPLRDIAHIDTKITEAEAAIGKADKPSEERKTRERKEDLMRLKRVEQIYVRFLSAVLPLLPGCVSVLLKLVLATISSPQQNQQQGPQSNNSSMFQSGVASPPEQLPPPPQSLEEIDVIRHREITSKAVSAIVLLTLKWFKASHVMKFHHLGQLLLDYNCLLLVLKMFGWQEVTASVVSKADSPDHNFFRYCQIHHARNPHATHEQPRPPFHVVVQTKNLPNGQKHEEEVEMLSEFSWRNFFAMINYAKIMQKLSKSRSHRIWMLVQYKSSAVLKRVLRVPHPMLQLHVLKLIKSQVPFCGRKWRQSNMKVITSIYLNCRPDLRDEWLTGTEVDDISDAQATNQAAAAHRRSVSLSQNMEGLPPGLDIGNVIRPLGTPNVVEADVFPPSRSQAPDPSIFLPYTTEDIAFEEEYEEYLSDLGFHDATMDTNPLFGGPNAMSAWSRLPESVTDITDNISDSESVVTIGDLGDGDGDGDDNRLDPSSTGSELQDENVNNWEHMSPKTMAALPKSPASARRSSSGSRLRPVLPFKLDDGSAVDAEEEEEDLPMGPAPREQEGPFASGGGVDEVEYAWG